MTKTTKSLENLPNYNSIRARFKDIAESATMAETMQAATWYAEAQDIARELSIRYNEPLDRVACVIAAFSPRTTWAKNVLNAQNFLAGEPVGTLTNNLNMARNGLRDGFSALKGRKTNSFAHNIAGYMNHVTVDVWMIRAAGYERLDANKGMYDLISDVITELARDYCVTPAQMQALIWIVVRGSAV